jgi:CxxC motif-containing protein (DUF1111 family)
MPGEILPVTEPKPMPIMKSPNPRNLVALLTLLSLGAVVAENLPNIEKASAVRQHHRHVIPPPRAGGRLGDPLPDLTQDQLNDFTTGLNQFLEVETVEAGLGPIYNNTSCANCHATPTVGGSGAGLETRFGHTDDKGNFDPLTELGGSLLQNQAIDPAALERIPDEANTIAQRQTTPLYGLGLIEAIPDQAIKDLAHRPKADGVLGRAALVNDVTTNEERVGRFGWKAQQATLLAFAADAYVNEMGITSRYFPTENAPNGDEKLLEEFDHVADPEDKPDATGKADIDRFADFMRYLAPPPPPRNTAEVQAGFALFMRLGCAECHVPTLFTGPNKIRALDRKPVTLFSDLLLHDMGSLNDGIAQADAQPNEMKTAPLWGLRWSAPYLHDGRAPTIADAIDGHDGEAATSRNRFDKLSAAQQKQLIEFLNNL